MEHQTERQHSLCESIYMGRIIATVETEIRWWLLMMRREILTGKGHEKKTVDDGNVLYLMWLLFTLPKNLASPK